VSLTTGIPSHVLLSIYEPDIRVESVWCIHFVLLQRMMIFDLWTPPTTKNYLPVAVVRRVGVGGVPICYQTSKLKMSCVVVQVLSRQVEAMDAAIDKLVYGLYDLTEEEIKIVEGVGK
jgi:hypothetical protein